MSISRFIEILGIIMLIPFDNHRQIKIIFVMIVYPLFFTVLQIWITDNFLKKNEGVNEDKSQNEMNDNIFLNNNLQLEENIKDEEVSILEKQSYNFQINYYHP